MKNYSITFKSLRAGTTYVVNIGGGTGAAVPLKGGAEPFTTEEDGEEDVFKQIRTQSGYIRIVDDGKDANGAAFDWKDLMPETDTSRPVTLTARPDANATGVVVWQGFMQAQNFGGVLYGNPQEREFPVQCPLTVLSTQQPTTTDIQLRTFAWMLNLVVTTTATLSGNSVGFDTICVQGGSDAQSWLLNKFDWQNLLTSDANNDLTSRYNLLEAFEDICRFWGWTARTVGRTLYLTCTDDQVEQTWLEMTAAQLATMAGGTTAGTTGCTFGTVILSGDIFASTDNEEMTVRGLNKAVVKVDCNQQDTVTKFAPGTVELQMEQLGYTWVQGEEDMTGYFTTQRIISFNSLSLAGTATAYGGFYRRQIYSSIEDTDATICDIIAIRRRYMSTPVIQLQTRKQMAFAGGSLSFSGSVWVGEKKWEYADNNDMIRVRIGIGQTRGTAQWFQMDMNSSDEITCGWDGSQHEVNLVASGGMIQGVACFWMHDGIIGHTTQFTTQSIPVPEPGPGEEGLNGYLFIDILGMTPDYDGEQDNFEIGDFAINFSRDMTYIPQSGDNTRPRSMKAARVSTKEYTSSNNASAEATYNVDCIYASDNNMEYGYGLVLNADGTFMQTAPYWIDNEHPEQHLADRIARYWRQSRRLLTMELRTNVITEPTAKDYVTVENQMGHFTPLAVSHAWRDDVTRLTLIEMP